jgi:hypothetical protein
VLFLIAIVALYTAIVGAFVRASGSAGSPAFITVLAAEIVFSLGTCAWLLNRFWRHTAQPGRADNGTTRQAGRVGAGLGMLAGPFVVLASLLTYGAVLAILLTWLAPVLPTERDARRALIEEIQNPRYHQHHGH